MFALGIVELSDGVLRRRGEIDLEPAFLESFFDDRPN
jgi:hypothetical protein